MIARKRPSALARTYGTHALMLCQTKRQRAEVLLAAAWNILGRYRRYRRVDFARVSRLVFVCTGNICRSPYAEARAIELGAAAVSFGLEAKPGARVNERAVRVASERGLRLEHCRSRGIRQITLKAGDLVVAMTPEQAGAAAADAATPRAQVTLLGLWGGFNLPVVPDPYGGGLRLFEDCFSIIDVAVQDLCERLSAFRVASGTAVSSPGEEMRGHGRHSSSSQDSH